MYEQIIQILEKNNLPYKNIFYQDNFGSWIFNNNEDYQEYILDNTQFEGNYLWILQNDKEQKFNISNVLQINNIIICLLEKVINNE